MTRIGVFTSGGDAPGMNAAIRAVVRTCIHRGVSCVGIERGFAGMIEGAFTPMDAESVSNIIQRGGTILKSARSDEFLSPAGRALAAEQLRRHAVDGLVAIGGDGTFRGAVALDAEQHIAIVGVPGTIDNDLFGTDKTIGFDTAVNTALEAIDKIRDTAESFERTFYIEVMGRHSGFIAAEVGLACGAEYVAVPETMTKFEELAAVLGSMRATKRSHLIIVAEGDEAGGAVDIARTMHDKYGIDYRVCILGHIQRGGNPTASDRALASVLGAGSVDALIHGQRGVMLGMIDNKVVYTPLRETYEKKKPLNLELVTLTDLLAK